MSLHRIACRSSHLLFNVEKLSYKLESVVFWILVVLITRSTQRAGNPNSQSFGHGHGRMQAEKGAAKRSEEVVDR